MNNPEPGASIGETLDNLITHHRHLVRTVNEDGASRMTNWFLASQHPDMVARLLTRAVSRLALVWPERKPPPPVVLTPFELQLGGIDRVDGPSPYRQIAAQLSEAMDDRRLKPGDRLPSESALIQHYGVSRMTVRRAFERLAAAGYIQSAQGSGVFVLDRNRRRAT